MLVGLKWITFLTNAPSINEAITALSTLKEYFISKSMLNCVESLNAMDNELFKSLAKNSKQATLDKYFVV